MTDPHFSALTLTARDAVVTWLHSDPLMTRFTASTDARALKAACETRLLAVLAAAVFAASKDALKLYDPEPKMPRLPELSEARHIIDLIIAALTGTAPDTIDRAGCDVPAAITRLSARLCDLSARCLQHSGSGDGRGLEWQVAYLERWLPQKIEEVRLAGTTSPREADDVLVRSHAELQQRVKALQDTLEVVRGHLADEVRSSQAASAIADELSVALEASRAQVSERDDHIAAIRAALDLPADGSTTIVAKVAHQMFDLRNFKTLPSDDAGIEAATRAGYEKQIAELREQLESAWRTTDSLRDRMADPEGMTSAVLRDRAVPFPTVSR